MTILGCYLVKVINNTVRVRLGLTSSSATYLVEMWESFRMELWTG